MRRHDGRRRPTVVVVTDPRWDLVRTTHVVEEAGRALGPGKLVVQLRDKAASAEALASTAQALREVTARVGALLVVNAPAIEVQGIAARAGADGVHVPCRHIAEAIERFGPSSWISSPAHTDDEVTAAVSAGASAVLVSPIFETPGKGPARGVEALAAARALARDRAVYALGGVDASRASACAGAGASGVAVIRALLDAPDPAAAATALDAPFQSPSCTWD